MEKFASLPLAAALLIAPATMFGQSNFGTISGKVEDPSHSPVAAVKVMKTASRPFLGEARPWPFRRKRMSRLNPMVFFSSISYLYRLWESH